LSGVSAATEQEQTERRVIVVFQATRSGKAVPGAQMWWMWDSKFTQILQILLAATQPYTKRIWQGIVGKWSGWSYAARTTSHIAIGVVRRPPNKTSRFARVTPQALRFFISSTVFLLPLTTRCDGCGWLRRVSILNRDDDAITTTQLDCNIITERAEHDAQCNSTETSRSSHKPRGCASCSRTFLCSLRWLAYRPLSC